MAPLCLLWELGRRMGLRGPGACSWELKITAWGREKGLANQKHSTEKRFPIKSLLCGEKIYIYFPLKLVCSRELGFKDF